MSRFTDSISKEHHDFPPVKLAKTYIPSTIGPAIKHKMAATMPVIALPTIGKQKHPEFIATVKP